jgi:hypothetical protein
MSAGTVRSESEKLIEKVEIKVADERSEVPPCTCDARPMVVSEDPRKSL